MMSTVLLLLLAAASSAFPLEGELSDQLQIVSAPASVARDLGAGFVDRVSLGFLGGLSQSHSHSYSRS